MRFALSVDYSLPPLAAPRKSGMNLRTRLPQAALDARIHPVRVLFQILFAKPTHVIATESCIRHAVERH